MNLTAKLLTSFVVAVMASSLTSLMMTGDWFEPRMLIGFFLATAATALLTSTTSSLAIARQETVAASAYPESSSSSSSASSSYSEGDSNGVRENGTVKWFNVSKGFGFITKDDGEEIFVHFRSIRGEGRRGLRDGQEVSFVEAQSDKGPQAEDVVGEN